jgi:hypothetical protein
LKTRANGHGGKRKGAGKPKGVLWPSTIAKQQARELTRQFITERIPRLLEAQLNNAEGIGHLMLRDPETGKFERVVSSGDPKVDEALIDAAIAQGKQQCWIYLKDPSVQAFTDLMNRALDKPKEQALEVNVKGELKAKSDAEILAALAAIQKKLRAE